MNMARDAALLTLPCHPAVVGTARRWVATRLHEWDRPDLVDSATLAVSELVTNAVLHVGSDVSVRLSGTPLSPRIEVGDRCPTPPRPAVLSGTEDELLTVTFGRGLALVAAHASAWGARRTDDRDGKVIWFEPLPEPLESPLDSHFFDLHGFEGFDEPASDWVTVWLLGTPARDYAAVRRHWQEIRRELRLLTLAHPGEFPVVEELNEVARQVDHDRRRANGTNALDEAILTGAELVDLRYDVPLEVTERMARLDSLIDQVMQGVTEDEMLAAGFTPHLRKLLRWYLSEFKRQAKGAAPRPWSAD